VTDTDDPRLERWETGERRRALYLALLAGAVLGQSLVIGALAFATWDLSDLLNKRSPVIARIDAAEADTECALAHKAVFLSAVSKVIVEATLEEGDTSRATPAMEDAARNLDKIAKGAEPCELEIVLP
jgi:hypothetical protein